MVKRKAPPGTPVDFDLTISPPTTPSHTTSYPTYATSYTSNAYLHTGAGSSNNPIALDSPPTKRQRTTTTPAKASMKASVSVSATQLTPSSAYAYTYPYSQASLSGASSQPMPSAVSSSIRIPAAGSSSQPAPTPARSKGKGAGKGKGKNKDPDAPVPEKRQAIMKKKCPQNIMERLERVTTQRFFMVDRKRLDGQLREEFQVLGSTGNVYTVVIDKLPSCNCPDAMKGNHCKHILFIYAKVLQVPFESHIWYQKALLTSELQEVFDGAPLAPNDIAHPHVRDAYARATGRAPANAQIPDAGKKKRIPEEGTECPICYEDMHRVSETQLVFCDECGNCLHQECFGQWANTKGVDITCPYCRAKWPTNVNPARGRGGAGPSTSGGYINLGNVAGLSPVRDTSTYYHGPRRGNRHYGYNRYDDFF